MTEDEMVGWHHRLNGHEFEQAPGDAEGLGACRAAVHGGAKDSDMTEQLNNINNNRNGAPLELFPVFIAVPAEPKSKSGSLSPRSYSRLIFWFLN